ncbi:hypothetical protein KEM52_002538, partial [Ascosphaera acerosa]
MAPRDPVLAQLADSDPFVVPERTLAAITKGPLTTFILSATADDITAILAIWSCLQRTFAAPTLIPSHRSAICNAIHAYFDSCLRSKSRELHAAALSQRQWTSLFDSFLERFSDSKPKSMRHVLGALITVLRKHPDRAVTRAILDDDVLPQLIAVIILGEPQARLKPCLTALEWLIRKDALNALSFIERVRCWLADADNQPAWLRVSTKQCELIGIPTQTLQQSHEPDPSANYYTAQLVTAAAISASIPLQILPTTGALVSLLCKQLRQGGLTKHSGLCVNEDRPFWLPVLRAVCLQNLQQIEEISNHVLFPICKTEPDGFQQLIDTLPLSVLTQGRDCNATEEELKLLFAILSTAKELGVVHEDTAPRKLDTSQDDTERETVVLRSRDVARFILHIDPAIRVSALAILITTPSTTKPLSEEALAVLRETLPFVYSDTDPQYRGEVFALLRKLLIRLRGGLATLHRGAAARLELTIQNSSSTQSHVEYLRWLVDFLQHELRPAASYQRHVAALRALILLAESGLDSQLAKKDLSKLGADQILWNVDVQIFTASLLQITATMLCDPFEDVRGLAMKLLALFPTNILNDSHDLLIEALDRAEAKARHTSRADHADSVARIYHLFFRLAADQTSAKACYDTKGGIVHLLLQKLESQCTNTQSCDFQLQLRDHPVHGYITALRYIISTQGFYQLLDQAASYTVWRGIHDRVLALCGHIWHGVRDILCLDSPEGQNDEMTEDVAGPKDVLSCSWRALRESSLLLHAVLTNRTYAPPDRITDADLSAIGELTFAQLAELRHRGAFSTVSQTFAACCQRCGASDDPRVRALPPQWFAKALQIIDKQSSSLTRRSAGLPALVTGVALFQPGGPFFSHVMNEMQKLAALVPDPQGHYPHLKLPQVHALNALKDLFTSTKLGPYTEPYISDALQLASDCLGSSIWAIRNCGLMLFRALMLRMCRSGGGSEEFGGESGAEPGNRIQFADWESLLPVTTALLRESGSDVLGALAGSRAAFGALAISTEKVFPALELIGEKAPATNHEDDETLRKLVARQLASPVWGVRDQAARIWASLHRTERLQTAIEAVLTRSLREMLTNNERHGHTLCIRYAFKRLWHSAQGCWRQDLISALDLVRRAFVTYFRPQSAPYVLAVLLEILNDAMLAMVHCGQAQAVQPFYEQVMSPADSVLMLHGSDEACSALIFRAFMYGTMIVHLSEPLNNVEPDFFASASTEEVDACRWVLDAIHRDFSIHAKSRHTRFGLYITILDPHAPLILREAAMSNMAEEITVMFCTGTEFSMEWEYLVQWAVAFMELEEGDDHLWSRDMETAALHFYGCIMALLVAEPNGIDMALSIDLGHVNRYAQKLRFATDDETSFTMRLAAAKSLKAFLAGLRIFSTTNMGHDGLLKPCLVLLDLLNDDDEEVREVAAAAVGYLT